MHNSVATFFPASDNLPRRRWKHLLQLKQESWKLTPEILFLVYYHLSICLSVYVCMYVCVYMYVCMYLSVCLSMHVCVCMYVCLYLSVCLCMYEYIWLSVLCIDLCIYMSIYLYIYLSCISLLITCLIVLHPFKNLAICFLWRKTNRESSVKR